ncbi:DNA repair protein RAD50 [Arabidopsis lyrata subsp. lyrata]|uniref:DNA repair protein RAD50 n=1 Tax=Arabidopsis lyrata subsp. lyrata TaxID=81972 RepID=UPI000A29ADF6|nr:DNA repair protein RAD50 [Arabidopsis lyrata subsp. lyrata]|eukprot:XP_020884073.1 DNA repair protein RAD50 [Arabidopsis lyrata subsp. lyrata]
MSTVDKMLIKGIRSFDPENKNVVTFFRPLTLIVGANGAGKTTIIECLKVSCTGELPPNARSGHSFIHDPKVAGETETKAQIKLRFKTAAGKDVVCIRSFQLTQKASKMEYKAIESVLQTINPHTGEKVCLSYRCADMDREIPALMGVSKAILENVIFVHQDESNWPLQDPSTLKKKFDDIFSATRYTKALEVIKKLHKDQAQEIKTFKLKLENLQTLKDAAYKLRESIAQDQERTESSKVQMLELETSIQKVDAEVHNKEMMLKDLRKLQDQVSRKTAERSTLFKEQQRQYAELPEENEDTIEELKEWKSKFEERIALLETKIRKMEREMDDTATTIYSLHNAKTNYMLEISKLQTEAEAHMLLKNERDSTIQKIFSHHNLGNVPSTPFGTEVVLNLTNRIKSRLGELEMDLLDKKKSNETALSTAWDCYMDANDRWKSIEAQKRAKDEIKMGISKRIEEKEIERDSFEFEISTVDVKQTDEREKQVQIELERKTKQNSELGFESKIEQKQHEIYSMEHKIKTLNRERDVMAGDAEDRVKLSLKKTEQENLRKKHKKIIDECKDRIRGVLKGRLPPEKDMKKEIVQALRSIEREYDDLSLKSREAEKEVNMLQMKIQEVNNSLFKHNKDTESRKKYIESKLQALKQESVTIDAYPKLLESAKDERDDRKSKYNMANGMRKMFEPFEDLARQHHYCPCCERSFTTDEENSFVKKQRVKASTTGEQLKKLAVESSNADSVFQQLDKLRAVFEEYSKLTSEIIPLAEKSLQEHTEELGQKSQALDDVLGISAQIKADKDSIEALVHPLENADRTFQEIVSYQKQIEDLEYKLDFRGLGVKTMEEIQSELSSLQSSKDKLHGELEKLRDDQIYMERDISCLQARWHAVREEKAKAANLLRDVTKAEEDLERLAEEKSQLDLDVKYLAEALGPLSKEKEQLLSDYNDMKIRRNQEYEELAEKKRNYQQEVEALLKASSKINEYHDLKKGERLNDIQEKQRLSESQLQSCEARKNELAGELNRNKDLMRNQDQLRRNIEDNLNYRTTKAKVEELTREIESLEEQILNIGGIPAVEAEIVKILRERERLLSELNRCRGTVSVYESSISKNRVELKAAQYKDIDKRHFDQLIQLKTTEMANKDLDRYYNALDKALMRFHTMKMEEINKIIRELWQQTYRGQDMDYIRIHSDSEGAGTRSYSYKVLMQTGDTELEMRGRCSAGQKVLASLIIRLALAETFCLNCGILALDEPTTNLDGPNSESLAGALLRIMEDRKGQENFQLIVITHDERFAQMIGQRQHAEKYYRVAKDDMQHSIIEAQEIFD